MFDFANPGWQQWWMVLSAAAVLVGLIGRQAVQAVLGARAVIARQEEEPEAAPLEQRIRPGRVAGGAFRRAVGRNAAQSRAGTFFFWLMVAGLVAHAAFWIHAAFAG